MGYYIITKLHVHGAWVDARKGSTTDTYQLPQDLSGHNSLLIALGDNDLAFFCFVDGAVLDIHARYVVCLFVCGISLTSSQLVSELFPDCTRSCFSQVVLRRRGNDRIYEMRCLFVAVGPNARFIVLSHWDNMS